MHRTLVATALLAFVFAGCRTNDVITTGSPGVQPAPPPANADAIPYGTVLQATLDQSLSTDRSQVGERFTATVTERLVAANGQVVVPVGAKLHGEVTGLSTARGTGQPAAIRLHFDRIEFGGHAHGVGVNILETQVHTHEHVETERMQRAAVTGAAAGAVLGAVIGGSLRDALVGGALGAGVGTVISLGLGTTEASLPAGTTMRLQTTQHVSLR
jgi:hypothetical protein